MDTITTEHIALIGFAARLGASVSAETEEDTSVREEAQLLMNLMNGQTMPNSLLCNEEIDTKSSDPSTMTGHGAATNTMGCDADASGVNGFSFKSPSLSLELDTSEMVESCSKPMAASPSEGCEWPEAGSSAVEISSRELTPNPKDLFSRMLRTNDRDKVTPTAETMARNLKKSFGIAMEWRARSWIDSLVRVLRLKGQKRTGASQDSRAAMKEGEGTVRSRGGLEEVQEHMMECDEAKVIASILRSSSEVRVSDVTTSFRVLSTCANAHRESKTERCATQPPPKKRRARAPACVAKHQYKVAHRLAFEAILTISSTNNDFNKMTVSLQAPGVIEGAFANHGIGAGEEVLTGVSLALDTAILAMSMETQSRFAVRKTSEAFMVSAPGMNYDSEENSTEELSRAHEVSTPKMSAYPSTPCYYANNEDAAVITPGHYGAPSPPSSCGSDEEIIMPPPPPRLPIEDWDCRDGGATKNPPMTESPSLRRVSPNPFSPRGLGRESILLSPRTPTGTSTVPILPSLVSPPPSWLREKPQETSQEGHLRPSIARKAGPSLPALVEVACAAMCAS